MLHLELVRAHRNLFKISFKLKITQNIQKTKHTLKTEDRIQLQPLHDSKILQYEGHAMDLRGTQHSAEDV